MRNIPLHERRPKKKLEQDETARTKTIASFIVPTGSLAFKEGYRECLQMYALHAPNKHRVTRILNEHCMNLENECLRTNMKRDRIAQYEGYRQAIKDLHRMKKIR